MLKNIFNLTRIFLISSSSRKNGKKRKVLSGLLYVFLLIYLAGSLGFLSYEIINGLISFSQENAFVGYILMAIISIVMFTTVVACINTYYFSKENAAILSLPLTPFEILSAKINTMMAYEYLEELIFGLVPLCVFGVMTHQPFLFYLFLIPVLLVLPILPLLIVSVIVMVLMAFFKGMRNKNMVQVITMTVSILFSLTVSMLGSNVSSQEDAMNMMNQANGLVELFRHTFPTMPMAISALLEQNFLALLGLILISVAVYLLVCVLCQKLFFKGVLQSLSSSSGVSNKKIDEKKAFRSKGLAFSYVMKEIRTYLRNPTFFVQMILPTLLLPIFIVIVFYVSFRSSGTDPLPVLVPIYQDQGFAGIVYTVLLIAFMFNCFYSFLPLIAVSKDGHDAYLMKYIPVPFHTQLIYKTVPDILACLFSWAVTATLIAVLFRVPIGLILMSFPVYLGFSLLHGSLILIDARHPKLQWTSEIRLVKNNLRTLWGIAYTLLNMGIVALLGVLLNLPPILMTLILTAFYLAIAVCIYLLIRKKDIALSNGFE